MKVLLLITILFSSFPVLGNEEEIKFCELKGFAEGVDDQLALRLIVSQMKRNLWLNWGQDCSMAYLNGKHFGEQEKERKKITSYGSDGWLPLQNYRLFRERMEHSLLDLMGYGTYKER